MYNSAIQQSVEEWIFEELLYQISLIIDDDVNEKMIHMDSKIYELLNVTKGQVFEAFCDMIERLKLESDLSIETLEECKTFKDIINYVK